MVWQKRARLLMLVIVAGVAITVFVNTRRREPPPAPKSVPRVDSTAVIESSGGFLVQLKGERENFTIRANKQLSYPDGSSKLIEVEITSVRQGKTFVVKGDEAKVGPDRSHLEVTGNVRLSASDGLVVTAGRATHSEGEGIVRAPGPVTFKRGRLSGKGVDFSYDEKRDVIGLSDQSTITIAPDEKGANSADVTAGSALLARKDKFIGLERAVHIVRPNQVIDADRALANLAADEEHLTGLGLQGHARITMPTAAPGGLTAMRGDVIDLTYADDSELIQRAVLSSDALLQLAGEKGASERALSAQTIDIGLAPDGATVTSLTARDRVALDLPAPRGQASKAIRATSLVATGTPAGGLTSAVFTDSVQYRETGGTPPVERAVTSRTLETALNGGLGEIRSAHFAGDVEFKDGSTEARAANVRYHLGSGQIELVGNVGNVRPRVDTDEIDVEAGYIEMTLSGPVLKAFESVRAVINPVKPGTKSANAKMMPGLMQQDRPVNSTSDELVYSNESGSHFSGHAQLWQGDDTRIRADDIEVSGKTGNLSASGSVASRFRVQSTNATTSQTETTTAQGNGQTMLYEDASRVLTYNTGARLVGPQGDLTARQIVLRLGENGQDIERLEASGDITLKETDRITKGHDLSYVGKSQEFRVSGTRDTLVHMISRTDQGCQEHTGNILTFSKTNDSLSIEGREASRSGSKAVSCAGSGLPPRIKLDSGAPTPRRLDPGAPAPPKLDPGVPAPRE
jgi:LPS export ABC transporter protein LptC